MTELDVWVPLAEIARPHGVRGELRLKLFNASSDLLLGRDEVLVRLKDGKELEVAIERARRADDAILVKLRSVDDRNRADELRGALVCLRRRDFPPTDGGEFYTVDIVGGEVKLAGARFGEVVEVADYPTLQVLVVRCDAADHEHGTWEIPLTETYVGKVDTGARTVELVTVEDLEPIPKKKPKPARPERAPRRGPRSRAAATGTANAEGDAGAAGTANAEGDAGAAGTASAAGTNAEPGTDASSDED